MMIITQIKAGETEKIVKEEMAGEMTMVSLGVKGFSAKSRNHPKIRQHMTHSHSMVDFGGQFTLTSDGQINRVKVNVNAIKVESYINCGKLNQDFK